MYPYWCPYTSYTDIFPKLFYWADFSADEDFFEDNDEYFGENIIAVIIKRMRSGILLGTHLRNIVED